VGQAASFIALNTYLTFSINGTARVHPCIRWTAALMDMYNNTPPRSNPDAVVEFTVQSTNYTAVVAALGAA
jgi:hypothetical protein